MIDIQINHNNNSNNKTKTGKTDDGAHRMASSTQIDLVYQKEITSSRSVEITTQLNCIS